MTRSGIVTVVGKPNAGKSTLLNRIVGQKLSIISAKPQSTRDRILGIHTAGDIQMVVLDTPGLLAPRYELQRVMRSTALKALADADVVVYLADATTGTPEPLHEAAQIERAPNVPVILALNKMDLVGDTARASLALGNPEARFISAATGDGVDALLSDVGSRLPDSPFLFPEADVATQSVRFFAAELVRETALEQLEDEVPYSVACDIEEFRETRSPVYIRAVIYVERDSQKAILIGQAGARIREIGRASRVKIEELIGAPVYLDLWVKVLANWRRNERSMKRFGYRTTEGSDR